MTPQIDRSTHQNRAKFRLTRNPGRRHTLTHTQTKQGDLEDKILKKNIPGKYTWWEKDSDEEGAGARADWVDREASDPEKEMTEMEKQKKWVDNDCPEPIRRTIMARQEKERARTGVKGVLADFDAWKLSADAGTWLMAAGGRTFCFAACLPMTCADVCRTVPTAASQEFGRMRGGCGVRGLC